MTAIPGPATPSVRSGKALPPRPGPQALARPALLETLEAAASATLVSVVASAGGGKTTTLAAWALERPLAWYSLDPGDRSLARVARGLLDALRVRVPALPADLLVAVSGQLGPDADGARIERAEVVAGLLADGLRDALGRDLVLVLDDLDALPARSSGMALVEALIRQAPAGLHLVLAGRDAPPFPVERLRGQGRVREIGGDQLALSSDEVGALVERSCGPAAVRHAGELHARTAGWPAVVRLAIEALRTVPVTEWPAALARLAGEGGRLQRFLVSEVLEREPPRTRALLGMAARLPRFDAELCAALGVDGAAEALGTLERRGLFLDPVGEPGWFRLSGVIRTAVQGSALPPPAGQAVVERALASLRERGRLAEALVYARELGHATAVAEIVAAHGSALIAAGEAEAVADACVLIPIGERTPVIEQLHGEALQITGRWDEALACFERIGATGALEPGVAWRMALIHYFRMDLDQALAVFERADLGRGSPVDRALLLAWWASVLWRKGDHDACRARALAAQAAALESSEPRALAASHTALAMLAALEGDRPGNDAHYLRALAAAEQAGDVLQVIRVRTNRSSHFLDEGFAAEALTEAELAVQLAGPAGFASFHALALNNRGEAAQQLGRLEEALADFRAAQAIEQRIGAGSVGYPLLGLGEVYRTRGDAALARAAYAEALVLARAAGDVQLLVPSLTGLACLLLVDDLTRARALADEAVALGPGMGYARALLTAAEVALAEGDRGRAAEDLARAEQVAAERRDRLALAGGLELRAQLEPERAADLLEEAVALWRQVGSPVGQLRATVAWGRAQGGVEGQALAARALDDLHRLGVRGPATGAAQPAADVEIFSLGGFRLRRQGQPVPVSAWQSRKARDLLKILVARRGRPSTREGLMELLWPGEDPEHLANRLSVALSTVRSTLDPDKRRDADWFVVAERTTIALHLDHCWVDVDRFLTAAEQGLALRARGRGDQARPLLEAAERLYAGDFCEEDLYEEWATALREQARAACIAVLRALASDAAQAGDHDAAARRYLRLLERDPFDEPAHLGLVAVLSAAGRHGEARRHYRAYTARMGELGVEPAPFPAAGT